jgi:anaerobic magnesium-protoporphyrin IX monomethyl ester cyclase
MKILFIYPNLNAQIGFNYGIAYLSAVLKQAGHTTGLLNVNEQLGYPLDLARIVSDIRAFGPDVIAFSLVTNQAGFAVQIAEEIKKHFSAPIVCGGIHPTISPQEMLDTGFFDVVFIGESEYALRDYVRILETGGDLSDVSNICYKKDGVIIKNSVSPFIPLEELPPKDYALFDFQKMIDAKNGWVGLMASRGCPFRCSYCFNHQIVELYCRDLDLPQGRLKYVRHHPVKDAIDEIRCLQATYTGISMFIFDDDLFTFDRSYLREFCAEYKKISAIPFTVNAHVQIFDADMARNLKDAGCSIVKFGIESGSERVRREVMNRHMKNDAIKQALAIAEEAGLHSSTFVMIGLPTETKDELLETIQLLADSKPGRFRWSVFFPFPHTAAYDISLKNGCIDFEKMNRLSNFTDESCLDFGPEHNLWLEKVAQAFPWYVNARSALPCAQSYAGLVAEIESMPAAAWAQAKDALRSRDEAESRRQQAAGHMHYAIRFNRFMGVRSDWTENE